MSQMPRLLRRIIIGISLLSLLLPQGAIFAEFNPNFILSDEELQDWKSMSRADIQTFLADHRGKISSMRHKDVEGKQRTTSDIIYRAAKEYQINPKYLLVKLQKEQSLITDTDPSQTQLDWATGYSVCDSCSMSDPDIQENKGFGIQVNKAAGIMRWYYDNKQSEDWVKRAGQTYTIDNQRVIPQTDATAFLYTYTPHLHGNQNFWTLWQRWFNQVYPDGMLVKVDGDPRVYVIQDGKKRAFRSFTALTTRFDPKLIATTLASELSRYPDGPDISLPNYAILKHENVHYLVDYDELRPFENNDVVRQLGYHPDEIIQVTSADIADYQIGRIITAEDTSPTGELIRVKEDGVVYFVKDRMMHPLFDEQIAKINFPHLSIRNASINTLTDISLGDPIALKDGTLLLVDGSNMVYVMEHGKKRHIASEEVFIGLGLRWTNIVRTNAQVGRLIPNGQKMYLRQAEEVQETEEQESVPYTELMQRTSVDAWEFIGPEFVTDVDTYLVADAETGEILLGKNVDVVRPMASFAKVMTAYEVMKEDYKPGGITTYDPEDHNGMYHSFRITAGEKLFNRDLLDATLISSINTATRMLVDSVEERESAFISRMNAQADRWNLDKTTFVDVTGEDERNLTTARDYLALFTNATQNATIRKTLNKEGYTYDEFKDLDDTPEHTDTHSNKLKTKAELPFDVLESKTGYLYESGANLAMRVERKNDGRKFIVITMGNVDYTNRFNEPERLTRWALDELDI